MVVFVYESRLATELSGSVIKVEVTLDRCFESVLSVADEVRTLSNSITSQNLEGRASKIGLQGEVWLTLQDAWGCCCLYCDHECPVGLEWPGSTGDCLVLLSLSHRHLCDKYSSVTNLHGLPGPFHVRVS